ncbi:MAG: hypothetical protein R3C56_23580 [Pirellulaceae bacterium]
MQLIEDGRLEVLLQVSERHVADGTDPDNSYVTWRVAYFHASLHGSVLPQSTLTDPPVP